ncbi:MAG TPA: hypothetical protein PK598_00945 [Thermoanaerobaculia bacterium]|nr:hypothetical protein [Thermoanaerobaculia bacterium]
MKLKILIAAVVADLVLSGGRVAAGETPSKAPADCAALQQDLSIDLKVVVKAGCMPSEAQIARLLENPVSNLVAVPFQYDYIQLEAPRAGVTKALSRLQIMPTFPLHLGSDWNLINRVVFPFLSVPINEAFGDCIGMGPAWVDTCPGFPDALADPFKRTGGFGDMVYVGLASPAKTVKVGSTGGTVIWGVGPTAMFPTASDEVLGYGKWGLGPAVVAAYLGPRWTLGVFAQHWWSIAGNSNRADVSLTNIQYFIYYKPDWSAEAQWRIGMSPNISINWKASGDKTLLPVGIGLSRLIQLGPLPVEVGIEADYSVLHPNDKPGSRWDFRVYFVPVIPTFLF